MFYYEYDVLEGMVTLRAVAGRILRLRRLALDQGVHMGRSLEQSLIKEFYEQGKLEPEERVASVKIDNQDPVHSNLCHDPSSLWLV